MPYVIPEDVGTTRRGSLSARRRLQAWERTGGTCVVCGTQIDGVRERWIVEHVRALELGGADDLDNMGPAHEACARTKTREDHARTAKAKRQKVQHLGAGVAPHPLPGSRGSPLKRKINGRVVLRKALPTGPAPEASVALGASPRSPGCSAPGPARPACPALNRSGMVNEARTNQPTVQTTVSKESVHDSAAMHDATKPNRSSSRSLTAAASPATSSLPASHVILVGEEAQQYEKLHADIARAVGPTDIIEEFWVRDVADLVWETLRLRRLKGALLQVAMSEGLDRIMKPMTDNSDFSGDLGRKILVRNFAKGTLSAKKEAQEMLEKAGLSFDVVLAEALAARLDNIERLDRLIASAEARRNAVLREVNRHRDALAARLARQSDAIIEAEFDEVTPDDRQASPQSEPTRPDADHP